jgi:benzoate membrane transport protein
MSERSDSPVVRSSLPALVAGFTVAIVFVAVLSIVLTAAGPHGMGLSDRQTSGWIAIVYGLPMIPSLVLSVRYRMPLLLTGNIFALIFFASLGGRFGFAELVGATIVAGAIVLITTLLGLTRRIADWIPAPIVQGLIAGAILPFVIDVFSALRTDGGTSLGVPITVATAVVAYLLALRIPLRLLGSRLPPIAPAFLAALPVAAVTGQLGAFPSLFALPRFELVAPTFSLGAIATVTPVLVALLTVQSNVPSVIYLRSQGFDPPERLVNVVSGGGTMLASAMGPLALSLALPPLLLMAGPDAGERSGRHRAVYVPIAAGLLIALFAGTAADIATFVPPILLLTMAGLALLPAMTAALREISAGPLVLGPLFALAIALSNLSILGLGPFFWALVLGTLVSLVFEPDGWRLVRERARAAE